MADINKTRRKGFKNAGRSKRDYSYIIPSPEDTRDYTITDIDDASAPEPVVRRLTAEKPLPKTYKSMVVHSKDVFNQGGTGMCVACSLSMMRFITETKQSKITGQFSPAYIYGHRSTITTKNGYGMTIREALSDLVANGVCSFKNFKTIGEYNKCNKQYEAHKKDLDKIAKKFRPSSYYQLNGIEEIKRCVYATGSALVVVPCYENADPEWHTFDDESKKTPMAYFSDYDKDHDWGAITGYHAMTCIGWNKDGLFLINSYGSDWGTNGKAYWSYEYPITEAWGIVDDNKPILSKAFRKLLDKKIV